MRWRQARAFSIPRAHTQRLTPSFDTAISSAHEVLPHSLFENETLLLVDIRVVKHFIHLRGVEERADGRRDDRNGLLDRLLRQSLTNLLKHTSEHGILKASLACFFQSPLCRLVRQRAQLHYQQWNTVTPTSVPPMMNEPAKSRA